MFEADHTLDILREDSGGCYKCDLDECICLYYPICEDCSFEQTQNRGSA